LSANEDITDQGIFYLCSDSRNGCCLKITSECDTSVNYEGMSTALLKLTDLEMLLMVSDGKSIILIHVLMYIADIYKETKKLRFKSVFFNEGRILPFVNMFKIFAIFYPM
jgi:hypothetical protein